MYLCTYKISVVTQSKLKSILELTFHYYYFFKKQSLNTGVTEGHLWRPPIINTFHFTGVLLKIKKDLRVSQVHITH